MNRAKSSMSWTLQRPPPLTLMSNRRAWGRRRRRRWGEHTHRTARVAFRPALAENTGQCRPERPSDGPVINQDAIAPTAGAAGAPTSQLCTRGHNTIHQTGGRRDLESDATRRAGGSGTEGRAAVAGGNTENFTEGKRRDNGGRGGCDRGQRRDYGGSSRLRSHRGGLAYPRGLRRLGELQQWSAPQ